MSEVNYDAKISETQQAIYDYRQQIYELEEKISKLQLLQTKISDCGNQLRSSVNKSIGQLENIFLLNRAINKSFFLNIREAVEGTKYTKAKQSLSSAEAEVEETISDLRKKKEQLEVKISDCQSVISGLYAEKAANIDE